MNCQRCSERPAEVHYVEVVGAEKKVQRLCRTCATQLGLLVLDTPPPAASPAPAPVASPRLRSSASRLKCEQCGTTLVAIRRTGRVGCALCYATFREHLEPLMRRVHRSLEHEGRRPTRRRPRPDDASLLHLRQELARAIQDEDYERAARLRDEIHTVQERAPGSESSF
jgi:protein arginine kinase activator